MYAVFEMAFLLVFAGLCIACPPLGIILILIINHFNTKNKKLEKEKNQKEFDPVAPLLGHIRN